MALVAQKQEIALSRREEMDVDVLPEGFPVALGTNRLWNGLREEEYTYYLTKDDVLETDAGLRHFKGLELRGDEVTRETFPLPKLQYVLWNLCNEVHNGRGFFLLRGLELDKYSLGDGMIIFLGIQAYIGEQRARQDGKGNMVVHIISDSTSPMRSLHSRHSRQSIAFHTEETGDIIAWQTKNTAARGGRCVISSAETIYNILAASRPDIIRTLARPDWPFALPRFEYRPVVFYHDSHLIINFCPAALLGSPAHPREPHLPCLTTEQREALDAVEAVARATELAITTRPGDLHFINNLSVLHRREEFVDDTEGGAGVAGQKTRQRHLLRMRIRNPHMGWELPEVLKGEWEKAFAEGAEREWCLEPMPEGFFPLRKYPL